MNRHIKYFTKFLLIVVLNVTLWGHIQAQNGVERLDAALNRITIAEKGALVSVSFIDGKTGEEIYSYGDVSAVPASLLKVATTATAIELFGKESPYKTELFRSRDSTSNTLVIRGGGDPTLGSKYSVGQDMQFIAHWCQDLKRSGITKIDTLILDLSWHSDEPIPAAWQWEDIGNYYGAGVSGLTFRDNRLAITLKSGAVGSIASVVSTGLLKKGVSIKSYVRSSNVKRDNAYIYAAPSGGEIRIRGEIPKNRTAFVIKGVHPNPHQLLAKEFIAKAKEVGIECGGVVIDEIFNSSVNYKILNPISITLSPSANKIAKTTNFRSVNLFAEHLFLASGKILGAKGFSDTGDSIVRFWRDRGVDCDGWRMSDGSGLSRTDVIRSKTVSSLLYYMGEKSSNSQQFLSTLPRVGVEGTVAYYFKGKPFTNRMRAKSGSMKGVNSLGGVMYSKSGNRIYFSLLTNHLTSSSKIRNYWASILEEIYQERYLE